MNASLCCEECWNSPNLPGLSCKNADCPCHTSPPVESSWELDPDNINPGDKHARLHNAINDVHASGYAYTPHDNFGEARKEIFAAVNFLLAEREADIRGKVEKIRRPIDKSLGYNVNRYDIGNNDALDDVLAALKNSKI